MLPRRVVKGKVVGSRIVGSAYEDGDGLALAGVEHVPGDVKVIEIGQCRRRGKGLGWGISDRRRERFRRGPGDGES